MKARIRRSLKRLVMHLWPFVLRSTLEESYRDGRELVRQCDFYKSRCHTLGLAKALMREPECTIVCDILANGKLLPDPNCERYGKMHNNLAEGRPSRSENGN